VWDLPLPLAELDASTHGERTVVVLGTEPKPASEPSSRTSREHHQRLVAVDVPNGRVMTFEWTAESVRDDVAPPESEGDST
jgi:hypothetical protein